MRRQREIKVFSLILAAVLFCTLFGCTRTTVPETEKPAEPVTEASTEAPSKTPTEAPAEAPTTTEVPTEAPTEAPTEGPTEAPTKAPTEAPTEPPTETPPAGDDARISLAQAILTESGTLTLLYGPEYRKGEQFNGERITDLWSGDEIIVQDVTPGWFGKGCEKYVIDESFAQVTPTNMAHWFEGCPEDGIVGLENLNTSRAEDMYNMFSYTGLKSLDLSTFDTSSVRLMDEMFRESVDLEYLDLSSFDTSNVTCMDRMFSGCVSLKTLDLSNFDCSKLESMFRMFEGAGMTTLDLSVKNLPSNLDTFGTFTYCTELEMIFCENSDTDFETEDTSTTFYCEKLKGYYGENEVPFKEFESGDRHLCSAKLGGYFTPKFMKITFDANGGTGEMEDLMALSYFYSGGGTDLPANAFAKEGVCFTGWNTEADGSGENYQDAAEIWPKEDLTLYAQWGDPEKMAQVIWTEEDKTLTFLCGPLYRPGDAFNGKTVTKTWCGMEVTATQLIWKNNIAMN